MRKVIWRKQAVFDRVIKNNSRKTPIPATITPTTTEVIDSDAVHLVDDIPDDADVVTFDERDDAFLPHVGAVQRAIAFWAAKQAWWIMRFRFVKHPLYACLIATKVLRRR